MSGRQKWARYRGQWSSARLAVLGLVCLAGLARAVYAQQRRERDPNSVYAERRARLAAQVDAPIILWGFTGREEVSQAYIFAQEENFYYLTGHNEEGAGLILLPTLKNRATGDVWDGPREMFFLPEKNPAKEKWNGARIAPSDSGVEARTGFATVKPFPEMRANVEKLAKTYSTFYTILPYEKELGGFPHEKAVVDWLQLAAPQAKLKDIRAQINALREIKSPGEIAFLKRAIDLSLDSHLEAMKMMRPASTNTRLRQKWSKSMPGAVLKPKATPRSSGPAPILRRSITTSSPARLKTATSLSSMSARNIPAIPRISRARCPPTASSRRDSARSTTLCSARKMPPSPL